MGIFDFFKNKKDSVSNNEDVASQFEKSEFFQAIQKYKDYIVLFIDMQLQGNYAPISAFEKPNGEIVGFLYVIGSDDSYSLSAEDAILKMEERFEKQLADNDILSYSILYHSQYNNDNNHTIAKQDDEFKGISIAFHFKDLLKGKIGMPYYFEGDELKFRGFTDLTAQENNILFNATPIAGKDYFAEREEVLPPTYENEIGVVIKKANTKNLSHTWCGVFGFESYRKSDGSNIIAQYFALVKTQGLKSQKNNLSFSEIEFQDLNFKAISQNENPITMFPVVKTDFSLDFETKEIVEWENVANLEAIISGRGRDTFGLWYFATDYAENKERYFSQKHININLSGIIFVLDIHEEDPNSEIKYSEDFTMYMPNNDLPNYACFDFIGQLEDYRESNFGENATRKNYLLEVRLITHSEMKDFFTIPMFVTQENMRFSELKKGMKLTGMFQLQGRIS